MNQELIFNDCMLETKLIDSQSGIRQITLKKNQIPIIDKELKPLEIYEIEGTYDGISIMKGSIIYIDKKNDIIFQGILISTDKINKIESKIFYLKIPTSITINPPPQQDSAGCPYPLKLNTIIFCIMPKTNPKELNFTLSEYTSDNEQEIYSSINLYDPTKVPSNFDTGKAHNTDITGTVDFDNGLIKIDGTLCYGSLTGEFELLTSVSNI